MIDPYKRYQVGLSLGEIFPSKEGLCSCGCNKPLTGRRTRWATNECNEQALYQFLIVKGDTETIRANLFNTDKGACNLCGKITEDWQADHILAVKDGGGGCGMDNFQTLCLKCHKAKTKLKIR